MYKFEVTAEMVYPKGIPKLAPGWEYVGFRPPVQGERVVCTDGSTYVSGNSSGHSPVLIARKQLGKVITFREILPKPASLLHGQFYTYNDGSIFPFTGNSFNFLDHKYRVFERTETEE